MREILICTSVAAIGAMITPSNPPNGPPAFFGLLSAEERTKNRRMAQHAQSTGERSRKRQDQGVAMLDVPQLMSDHGGDFAWVEQPE